MAESPSNTSKNFSPALTLILPLAIILLFLQKILPLLIAIATASGGWHLLRRTQRKIRQHQGNLDDIFYRLLQQHQGRMTVLDLAMHTKLPPQQVQQYLDQRAAEFSAQFEVTEQGGMVYCFETVQSLSSLGRLTESQTVSPPKTSNNPVSLFPLAAPSSAEVIPSFPQELKQSELAQRLNVHPSTIRNWKHKPEFQQWSQQKDPDAIAWYYCFEKKRFYPMI